MAITNDYKILFLDFDGVLNNAKLRANVRRKYLSGVHNIDPLTIGLLNRIVMRTGALIVVSSCWRFDFTLKEIRKILAYHGFLFSSSVIGSTPVSNATGLTDVPNRKFEILEWLTSHPTYRVENMAIIDDHDLFAGVPDGTHKFNKMKQRFVKTDGRNGLLEKHANRVVELLGICPTKPSLFPGLVTS